MGIGIVNMVLPILVVLILGMTARRRNWMDAAGVKTIKGLVSRIMLPVILFNAFLFAEYTIDTLKIIVVIFVSMTLVFLVGFPVRKLFPTHAKYVPFLVSSIEGGTIGYPLLAMLFGAQGTVNMAVVDVGHTIFLFAISVPLLKITDGQDPDVKGILKGLITAPTLDAMVLGILCGVMGLDTMLVNLGIAETFSSLVGFITGPAGMLILLSLGYELSFDGEKLKSVAATAFTRLVIMGIFCTVTCLVILKLVSIDQTMLYCIIFAYALPASYGLFMFSDFKGEEEYVATTISFSTLLTLIFFIGLAVVSQ